MITNRRLATAIATCLILTAINTGFALNNHHRINDVVTTSQIHTEQFKQYEVKALKSEETAARGAIAVENLVKATTELTATTNRLVIAVSKLEQAVYEDK
ncbi:TPA: hypothetical protein NGT37_001037 [Vibrio parahaemolyticus]|nr:hypothetical protein [Vibrio parahaemolyticus]